MPSTPQPPILDLDVQQGTARIGAELRRVRENLGWNLADVAASLRIRLPYLEAIEAGALTDLPGPAYQTGFVRTYARALGLDAEEILRRFRAEGLGATPPSELRFLAPVPDRAVPTGAIVLLGVILLLAGYGLWYRHTEHERRLAAAIPSIPAELAPLALPKTITPALPPKPISPSAPAVATAPTVMPASRGQRASNQASIHNLPTPAAPTTPATGQTITATGDSWVQVQDPSGNILFSRVLHAGDSWPVPDIAGLTMTAGNAGATIITTNGVSSPPIGPTGTVIHNFVLTPPATITPAPTP